MKAHENNDFELVSETSFLLLIFSLFMKESVFDFLTLVSVGYVIGFVLGQLYFRPNCEHSNSENNDPKYKNTRQLVYIGILTTRDYLSTRGQALLDTWADDTRHIRFYIGAKNQSDSKIPKSLKHLVINLKNVDDRAYPPQKKSLLMIEHFYKLKNDYQFFMRADDDVYVKPEKLKMFLRTLNSTKKLLIGQSGGFGGNTEDLVLEEHPNYCMGGPGVIFSHSLIEKFGGKVRSCLKDSIFTYHEDVELSRCVHKWTGVSCLSGLDGKDYFFQNYLGNGGNLNEESILGDRLGVENAITLHPNKNGDGIRSLHWYLKSLEMKKLRFKVERLEKKPDVLRRDRVLPWDQILRTSSVLANHSVALFNAMESKILETAENELFGYKNMDRKLDRSLSLKSINVGYFRVCPLLGLDLVYDLSVRYSRFYKMKVMESRNRFEVLAKVFSRVHFGFGKSHVRKVNARWSGGLNETIFQL